MESRVSKRVHLVRTEVSNLSDVGVRIPKRILSDALTVGDSLQRTLSVVKIEALLFIDKKRKEYSSIFEEHFVVGDTIRSFKSLFRRFGSKATRTSKDHAPTKITQERKSKQTTPQTEIDDDN